MVTDLIKPSSTSIRDNESLNEGGRRMKWLVINEGEGMKKEKN